jgi:OmpA-OmpF porin, OOP family
MTHWTLRTLTAALLVSAAASAMAQTAQDAAYDKRNGFVSDTNGHCVRTKWMGKEDACNPRPAAPAPAPKVAAPAPAAVPVVSLEQRSIYFDFNKSTLTAESAAKLDGLAQIINNSASIKDVRIHGFTDQFGTTGYNDKLANARAAVVKSYLDGKSRLATTVGDVKGIGKSSPEAGCGAIKKRIDKIACMAKERRVEVEFKAEK